MSSEPYGHGPSRPLARARKSSEPTTASEGVGRGQRDLAALFPDRGWIRASNWIDATRIDPVREFLADRHQRLMQRFSQWSGETVETQEQFNRASARIAHYEQRGLPKDLRHFLTGEFDLETRLDPRIRELLCSEALVDAMRSFLQRDQYFVHYPPMIRFKVSGAQASLVPLHQDSAYNTHITDFITVWLPLADIDAKHGGVVMYNGSHAEGCTTHRSTEEAWASKADVDLSAYEAEHVPMKAGDLLLFPADLFHESAPYEGRLPRYSIDFRVFREHGDTARSYLDPIHNRIQRMD